MSDPKDESPEPSPEPGVLITKGMRISIPKGGLQVTVGEDGAIEATLQLHIGLDLCHHWLGIAVSHVLEGRRASGELHDAQAAQDNEGLSHALEAEFKAGMQAMMAAAVAIDAFYGSVKDRIAIPSDQVSAWKKNKTARYKQLSEVFRLGFHLPGDPDTKQVRHILKEVFRSRDLAVHPPAKTMAPAVHPGLNQASDWRCAAFCFQNARESTRMALDVITQLASKACRGGASPLRSYCESLQTSSQLTIELWEGEFGPLNPTTNTPHEDA